MIPSTIPERDRPRVLHSVPRTALIDIVVPVYNEQAALERSIRRLHAFLSANMPVRLADRDRRQRQHRRDAGDRAGAGARAPEHRPSCTSRPRAAAARCAPRGRRSDADVLCYMDVDLSTDLRALLPLDRGAGLRPQRRRDRHPPGARRAGRPRPQARAHLPQLQPAAAPRAAARASPTPSAASRRSAPTSPGRCCPTSSDDGWFFDTELLVLAQRRGPADSRGRRSTGSMTPTRAWTSSAPRSRPARRRPAAAPRGRWPLPDHRRGLDDRLRDRCTCCCERRSARAAANALALALTAVANTQANRRFTFGVRGRAGLLRQHAAGARGLPARARADRRRARRPARQSIRTRRGRSRWSCWSLRQRARHRHPLRRAAHLGVRPPAQPRAACARYRH